MKLNNTLFVLILIAMSELAASKQPTRLSPIPETTRSLQPLAGSSPAVHSMQIQQAASSSSQPNSSTQQSASSRSQPSKQKTKKRELDLCEEIAAALLAEQAEQSDPKRQKSGMQLNLRIAHESPDEVIARCLEYPALGTEIEKNKIIIENQFTHEATIYLGHSDKMCCIQKNIKGKMEWQRVQDFSLDERYFITSSEDKTVRIWDIESQHARVLKGFASPVTALAINKKSTRLITGCADGTLVAWDLINNIKHAVSRYYTAKITAVTFEPESDQFKVEILGQPDGFWDVHGTGISCLSDDIPVLEESDLSISADGKYMAAGSHSSSSTNGSNTATSSSSSSISPATAARATKKFVQLYPWYYWGWHTQAEIDQAERNMRDAGTMSPRMLFSSQRLLLAEKYNARCIELVRDQRRFAQLDGWGQYWDVACALTSIEEIFLSDWDKSRAEAALAQLDQLTQNRIYQPEHVTKIIQKVTEIRELINLTRAEYTAREEKKVLQQSMLKKLAETETAYEHAKELREKELKQKELQDRKTPENGNCSPIKKEPSSSSRSMSMSIGKVPVNPLLSAAQEKVEAYVKNMQNLDRWNSLSDFAQSQEVEHLFWAILDQYLIDRDSAIAIASLQSAAKIVNEQSSLSTQSGKSVQELVDQLVKIIEYSPHQLEKFLYMQKEHINRAITGVNDSFALILTLIKNMHSAGDETTARNYLHTAMNVAGSASLHKTIDDTADSISSHIENLRLASRYFADRYLLALKDAEEQVTFAKKRVDEAVESFNKKFGAQSSPSSSATSPAAATNSQQQNQSKK